MLKFLCPALFVCAGYASLSCASPLLTNGGFETGNLSGWTVTGQAGSFPGSNFFAVSGTNTPQSGLTTVGPASGTFYAVSDSRGAEAHALIQGFTVPSPASSVILSFSLFVNSYGGDTVNPIGLDISDGPNQHARVDILTAGTSALTTTGVLQNFYLGTDPGVSPHIYTNYSFNITPLVGAGGTFQLRFAEVNNVSFLNMGVDNVSIDFTAANVPEPSGIILAALGSAAVLVIRRRRLA
jgi:hypothetical protein